LTILPQCAAGENAVGRERLDMRLLEPDWLVAGDLIDDFCTACGISAAGLARPARRNRALSAEAAELLRVFNRTHPVRRPDGRRDPLAVALRQRIEALRMPGTPIALSADQLERVRQHYKSGNEKLRAARFPDRPELFPDRAAPPDPRSTADLREDALALAARLLEGPGLDRRGWRVRTVDALPAPLRQAARRIRAALPASVP
jgi:hypothetical protein